ncbi:hypothetical protein [Comamonas terrae]
MTYLYAACPAIQAPQHKMIAPLPAPLSPEEVLRILSQNPPSNEFSTEAF